MEYSSLYELIKYLQYGTKLHIGVLFFGNHGNEKCILPSNQGIHSSPVCWEFKERSENNFKRCFRCRNLALQKALSEKIPFDGLCINGVYEYTRPVVINWEVVCVIFIGNILDKEKGIKKLKHKLNGKVSLFETMEKDFDRTQCDVLGGIIESYIRVLLKKFKGKQQNTNSLVENIKNYINESLEYDIKISHIAKVFHYNERYIGRLFKKESGYSVNDYITGQRLIKAKELLENGNDSIISVSTRAGFNNVTYFNRLFKKEYCLTPTQYRAEYRSEYRSEKQSGT